MGLPWRTRGDLGPTLEDGTGWGRSARLRARWCLDRPARRPQGTQRGGGHAGEFEACVLSLVSGYQTGSRDGFCLSGVVANRHSGRDVAGDDGGDRK